MSQPTLSLTKDLTIRFSEVDSMGVVWHGAYALYLEDAREAFGLKYGLDYMGMVARGFYVPMVDMHIRYRQPIIYGQAVTLRIDYVPTEAAKLIFDYTLTDSQTGEVLCTARTIQVFIHKSDRRLAWTCPDFYDAWKERWNIHA